MEIFDVQTFFGDEIFLFLQQFLSRILFTPQNNSISIFTLPWQFQE